MGAGYLDQVVEGGLLRREPRIPLEGVKVSRNPMYVNCDKAVMELGLPQSPVETALEKSIDWFNENGYTCGSQPVDWFNENGYTYGNQPSK